MCRGVNVKVKPDLRKSVASVVMREGLAPKDATMRQDIARNITRRGPAAPWRGEVELYDPFERIFTVGRQTRGEPFDGFAARPSRGPHF
jgi:hypothetical protein